MKNTKNTIETIITLELAEDLNFLTTTESLIDAMPVIKKYKTIINLPNPAIAYSFNNSGNLTEYDIKMIREDYDQLARFVTKICLEIGKELARRVIEDDKQLVEYTNKLEAEELEKEKNFSNK